MGRRQSLCLVDERLGVSRVGMAEDRVLLLPTMQRMMWIPLAQESLKPGRYRADVIVDYGDRLTAEKKFTVELAAPDVQPPPAAPTD